jgi:hypothetical protein
MKWIAWGMFVIEERDPDRAKTGGSIKVKITWKLSLSFVFEAIVRPRPVKKTAIRNMKINSRTRLIILGIVNPLVVHWYRIGVFNIEYPTRLLIAFWCFATRWLYKRQTHGKRTRVDVITIAVK